MERRKEGEEVEMLAGSNNEEISILFQSLRTLFIYSPERGDGSVRENFSLFLLQRFSLSPLSHLPSLATFFLSEKDAPRPLTRPRES